MTRIPSAPPITDHLAIALRAFATPKWSEKKDPQPIARKASRLRPSRHTIIFDTETTSDAAQSLRFGTFQVREGDKLLEAGIFYDSAGTTPAELEILRSHADTNGLRLITREMFVEEIFYGIGYDTHANIVGFNLPFDISRIAIGHGSAKGKMRGGFTFKLSPHAWTPPNRARPNVQIKHISRRSAFIQFASAGQPQSGAGQRKKKPVPTRRGHFIDVRTLAGALFAGSFRLAELGQHLGVENAKLDAPDFGGAVTDEMVRYAVRDVQTTWECYAAVAARFTAFGLSRTGPNRIYSEAGIGKAYLKEMGIRPWQKVQPNVPASLLGNIMSSYYGGRSEVRIRREIRQVMLCDFLSMYPTVCILMKLWRFVIAEGMTWRDSTVETRQFVERIDLPALQSQNIWESFATLVRVKPDADVFPIRAAYAGTGETTIGANYLTNETPQWFTLADCLASKLLTGKTPEIVEAISFTPGPVQDGLSPIMINGNPDYKVDPEVDDLYARVIALRRATQARKKAATDPAERDALGVEEFSLKLVANSTSYGIFQEVNVEDFDKPFSVSVHSGIGEPFSFGSKKHEEPGTFFHPLLGSLITGAARLMLAITEKLIADAGLVWAFCDTDSMAIAKPEAMLISDFYRKVEAIVAWFSALNPHGAGSIFKIEPENEAIGGGDRVPLYVLAVSAKRYALFNLDTDGLPVIRKASQHGLGHLTAPYEATDPAPGIPAPSDSLAKIGVDHWQHDYWWRSVSAALAGHPDQMPLDYHASLSLPAISRYAATSPKLLRWFKRYNSTRAYRDQVKPFGFLTSLSVAPLAGDESFVQRKRGRRPKLQPIRPIAPFDRDPAIAAANAFDRDTGEAIGSDRLRSYARALMQYHLHPESKFQNGDYLDRGTTIRRHIHATSARLIGKESNDWEEAMYLSFIGDPVPDYGNPPAGIDDLAWELRTLAGHFGKSGLAQRLAVSRPALTGLLAGQPKVHGRLAAALRLKLPEVIIEMQEDWAVQAEKLRMLEETVKRLGLQGAATGLNRGPSNLKRLIAHLRSASADNDTNSNHAFDRD